MGSFHNVVLDTTLSVNGWKPSRLPNVVITNTASWTEDRFARSPWPRKKYKIPFADLSQAQREYLVGFYDGRIGPTFSFLLWDRDENFLSAQRVGTGDGSTTIFQIAVSVGDATHNSLKPLLHPVPTGTTIPKELQGSGVPATALWTVTDNGVTKTEGVDYTISATTGKITFTSAPANTHAIVVTGWYYTCVRFDGAEFEIELNSIWGSVQGDLIEVFNE